jgi:choline dehydrogenase-like flavoprotein
VIRPLTYDVCVIGSGAGAGPIIYELAKAGYRVLVLEKGPWFKTEHWTKDDMVATRRSVYTPSLKDEFHVLETKDEDGKWSAIPTFESGRNFWNGSAVGGSSNFMSAYFHRMKPNDFKQKTVYGDMENANITDWPISYDDLELYYTKVEAVVGVSGVVTPHKFLEPRSTPDYLFPPLATNKLADWFTEAGIKTGHNIIPVARGILSVPHGDRRACYLSNYCGSFGCSSDAKGSSRAALINEALKTGNVEIRPESKVFHLETDEQNNIIKAHYYNQIGVKLSVEAGIFVVAAQAVETSRLLLMSKNPSCPDGLANNSGNVGKNLIFSAVATGSGQIVYSEFPEEKIAQIDNPQTFVNRTLLDFYEIDDAETGKTIKGGIIDFLIEHSNAMPKLMRAKKDGARLLYGSELKSKIHDYFTARKKIRFEAFTDWIPNDDCFVSLDPEHKDRWGDPVARVRLGYHPNNAKPCNKLAEVAKSIFIAMGAKRISGGPSQAPTVNLQAGGCRFGNDPKTSVLDKNCKAHEVGNLYITDGSFMPTGGSVPYTFTIYANAFRVADKIVERLRK